MPWCVSWGLSKDACEKKSRWTHHLSVSTTTTTTTPATTTTTKNKNKNKNKNNHNTCTGQNPNKQHMTKCHQSSRQRSNVRSSHHTILPYLIPSTCAASFALLFFLIGTYSVRGTIRMTEVPGMIVLLHQSRWVFRLKLMSNLMNDFKQCLTAKSQKRAPNFETHPWSCRAICLESKLFWRTEDKLLCFQAIIKSNSLFVRFWR